MTRESDDPNSKVSETLTSAPVLSEHRTLGSSDTRPSFLSSALRLRCPKCGEGKLFSGVLEIHAQCPHCGFDLRNQDSGDGPVFFALVIVGFLVIGMLAVLEAAFSLPLWLELGILTLVAFTGTLIVLRISKAALIALQFKHRIRGFEHDA
jgi:uncharacterized protein (DUF983 family)